MGKDDMFAWLVLYQNNSSKAFLNGIARIDSRLVILLDLNKVFSKEEIAQTAALVS
jgi:chemotaxis signal transduction protein